LWILSLLIPIQIFSYYAAGNIVFAYLKAKGNLKDVTRWTMARMSLELNFVNHILPSGGAAGFSYLGWVLSRHGVSAGRATMSQIVRFAATFVAFLSLMAVSVLILVLDHSISRAVIFVSIILVTVGVVGAVLLVYIIGNKHRIIRFSDWLTNISNRIILFIGRGKTKHLVKEEVFRIFFTDLHQDYVDIRSEKNILLKPFAWGILLNLADALLLFVSFLAMGIWVNPFVLLIAFGTSAVAGIISVLPAGAGVYEAVMIGFLVSAGVPSDIAIAGTLISRVTLVTGTILFGYIFYQLTVLKYGKRPTNS
jgi:uncharacterized protein (TIRG00374 family)